MSVKQETKGSALGTGQIELMIRESVLSALADDNGINAFFKLICASSARTRKPFGATL
jgi:hypothetical protein